VIFILCQIVQHVSALQGHYEALVFIKTALHTIFSTFLKYQYLMMAL